MKNQSVNPLSCSIIPDEEDPGTICALLGAIKLNVWGGEEDYSVYLQQEEEKSGGKGLAKRARKRRV